MAWILYFSDINLAVVGSFHGGLPYFLQQELGTVNAHTGLRLLRQAAPDGALHGRHRALEAIHVLREGLRVRQQLRRVQVVRLQARQALPQLRNVLLAHTEGIHANTERVSVPHFGFQRRHVGLHCLHLHGRLHHITVSSAKGCYNFDQSMRHSPSQIS
jgi:hypothetical protein